MPSNYPMVSWLRRRLEEALAIMSVRSPDHAYTINQTRKALANDSPVVADRFANCASNCLGGPERYDYTDEEKTLIGGLLNDLPRWQAGKLRIEDLKRRASGADDGQEETEEEA